MSNDSTDQLQHYGGDIAIRSILIRSSHPGHITVAMEDISHALQIDLTHDNNRVTDLHGKWFRYPLSSCQHAYEKLPAFVGCPLTSDIFSVRSYTDALCQCTHMFDMTVLGIIHAAQSRSDCRYDVIMTKPQSGITHATLKRNGTAIWSMDVKDYNLIISPPELSGRSIYKGFLQRASNEFPKGVVEYYYILQKALFVARGQIVDINTMAGEKISLTGFPQGVCYGSAPSRYTNAVNLGNRRDFYSESEAEHQVLQFIP